MSDAKTRTLAAFDEFMDSMASLRANIEDCGDCLVPQWISVKDRKPGPDDMPMLAYDAARNAWGLWREFLPLDYTHWVPLSELKPVEGVEPAPRKTGWNSIDDPQPDGSPRYTVTHWAPLPEPPKEDI
jgi:hypothetical protein